MSVPAEMIFAIAVAAAVCVCPTESWSRDQGEWADLLERNEKMVWSMEAVAQQQLFPTQPEEIERFRRLCEADGIDFSKVSDRIINESNAEWLSYPYKYWQSGVMERFDRMPPAEKIEGHPYGFISTKAYDGHIYRSLEYFEEIGKLNGTISDGETWRHTVNHYPSEFISSLAATPYSEVVRSSTEFSSEETTRAGESFTLVQVSIPKWSVRVDLMFDDRDRLVERTRTTYVINTEELVTAEQIKEELRDYRLVTTSDGNAIWFPYEMTVWFNVLRGPSDGVVVINTARNVQTIQEIAFNKDIPVETFQIEFPPEANIYDALTGAGMLRGEGGVMERLVSDLEEQVDLMLADDEVEPFAAAGSEAANTSDGKATAPEATARAESERPWWLYVVGAILFLAVIGLAFQRGRAARSGRPAAEA